MLIFKYKAFFKSEQSKGNIILNCLHQDRYNGKLQVMTAGLSVYFPEKGFCYSFVFFCYNHCIASLSVFFFYFDFILKSGLCMLNSRRVFVYSYKSYLPSVVIFCFSVFYSSSGFCCLECLRWIPKCRTTCCSWI